jgi:hypothetical protein
VSDDQSSNFNRVNSKIALHILGFFEGKVGVEFHVAELLTYVRTRVPDLAPDSPGRIMRDLRAKNLISYEVVNRRDSLYRILPVKTVTVLKQAEFPMDE